MSAKPIPVRLPEDVIARLDAAAESLGLDNRSEVIKLCISTFVKHVEMHGKLCLPMDWEEILKDMDGRTHRYAKKVDMSMRGKQVAAFGGQIIGSPVTESGPPPRKKSKRRKS